MKILLESMIKEIEIISEETDSHKNEEKEINGLI